LDNILVCRNITKQFPGVLALDNVSISIRRGEIHALVGENGAGKSTLMKILTGVYQPDSGEVIFEGQPVRFTNPRQAMDRGISIIHQEFSLLSYLNAYENIFLGREAKKLGVFSDKQAMKEEARRYLAMLGIEIDLEVPIERLSVAERQFIEIAKAVAQDAKILILDEPTATLTVRETERLFNVMKGLKAQGVSMIYISHHLNEIFEMCDRVTCLRDGQVVCTKDVNELCQAELVRHMVGRELTNTFPAMRHKPSSEPVLEVKRLANPGEFDVSFSLRRGEILGIAGLIGSGRTEILRALFGADRAAVHEVYMEGRKLEIKSPEQALQYGIGLIPEDRKAQGLILGHCVRHNISLTHINKLSTKGFISARKERQSVLEKVEALRIKVPDIEHLVMNLSGGNQQKVVLAKWLATDCRVLIFDEPTRGIDVGAKSEIYELMDALAEQGISIIMISSELPEVIGMSDRILVIRKGQISAELPAGATQEQILEYAIGGDVG
jgi:ribose transport system ATP-binding protein